MNDNNSPANAVLRAPQTIHLGNRFQNIRAATLDLCQPLEPEDYMLQAEAFVSPVKWHLAHVTWFFETFLLKPFLPDYKDFKLGFDKLFNSYYQGVGTPFTRARRGLLSRPSLQDVWAYRRYVDSHMIKLLEQFGDHSPVLERTVLGLHHEQQHQELILMDLKYNFYQNPLLPIYQALQKEASPAISHTLKWHEFEGGLVTVGYQGNDFCFDNETPAHEYFLQPFLLANRLVTNGEYAAFIAAGGYRDHRFWLSDGWDWVQQHNVSAPLYWYQQDGTWFEFSLHGNHEIVADAPVCHVSLYEASAFACWSGARLPTEQEWEQAAKNRACEGHFSKSGVFQPKSEPGISQDLNQLFGSVWEWTQSAYSPYPGFKPPEGAIGEYNGKFMCNQMVLRGGSCVTPQDHIRASYRNFFFPADRWSFCGIRLAKS